MRTEPPPGWNSVPSGERATSHGCIKIPLDATRFFVEVLPIYPLDIPGEFCYPSYRSYPDNFIRG